MYLYNISLFFLFSLTMNLKNKLCIKVFKGPKYCFNTMLLLIIILAKSGSSFKTSPYKNLNNRMRIDSLFRVYVNPHE